MTFAEQMKSRFSLSDDSIETLLSDMYRRSYKKGEIIAEEGFGNYSVYYVETGFVRCYALKGGEYRTFMFAFEGDMIFTAADSSSNRSKLTLEASVDSTLLKISRKRMEELFNESIELANWGRKLAEKSLGDYEHYFLDYFWNDKTTQYHKLVNEYPELLQSVSLKELASYLNMTPQSLSRIRAKKSN